MTQVLILFGVLLLSLMIHYFVVIEEFATLDAGEVYLTTQLVPTNSALKLYGTKSKVLYEGKDAKPQLLIIEKELSKLPTTFMWKSGRPFEKEQQLNKFSGMINKIIVDNKISSIKPLTPFKYPPAPAVVAAAAATKPIVATPAVAKPVVAASKPVVAAPKPVVAATVVAPKPIVAAPVVAAPKPVVAAPKPVVAATVVAPKPVVAAPVVAAPKPVVVAPKPVIAASTAAPVIVAPKPVVAAPKPVVAAQVVSGPKPVIAATVAAPKPAVALPASVAVPKPVAVAPMAPPKPIVVAPKPVVAAPKPIVVAPKPVVAAPKLIVAAPMVSPKPVVATLKPIVVAPKPIIAPMPSTIKTALQPTMKPIVSTPNIQSTKPIVTSLPPTPRITSTPFTRLIDTLTFFSPKAATSMGASLVQGFFSSVDEEEVEPFEDEQEFIETYFSTTKDVPVGPKDTANESLAERTAKPVLPNDVDASVTNALNQGKEFLRSGCKPKPRPTPPCPAPKPAPCNCPTPKPVPFPCNSSDYIRKDQIPCWGCTLK